MRRNSFNTNYTCTNFKLEKTLNFESSLPADCLRHFFHALKTLDKGHDHLDLRRVYPTGSLTRFYLIYMSPKKRRVNRRQLGQFS